MPVENTTYNNCNKSFTTAPATVDSSPEPSPRSFTVAISDFKPTSRNIQQSMETYSQRFSNPSFALAVEINRLAWKSLEMERQTMLYRINEQAEALSLLRSGYAHSGIVMDEVRLEMEAMEKSPEYLEYVKEAEEHKKALQLQGQLSEINALHDVFCSLKSAKSSGFPPKSEHGPEESDDDNWGLTDYNSDSDE